MTLFSVTIEISCTKKFAGSDGDPTLAELLDVAARRDLGGLERLLRGVRIDGP